MRHYDCPYCDQKSTRRWNLETHIKRRHGGTGQPIPVPNVPFQSPVNYRVSSFPNSSSSNSIFSTSNSDPMALQRQIIEFARIVSPWIYGFRPSLSPGLYGAQPMNVGFSGGRNVLGYKGHVCNKCLSWEIGEIHDDEKELLRSNHTCDPQKLQEMQSVTDIPGTINKQRLELIFYLTLACTNDMYNQQELVDLTAVEIPPRVFDKQSDSYEEYVDLDSLPPGIPDWVHRAVKEGRTFVNRTGLAEFLSIFGATLGFFRLTIYGVKQYFFVYIAKGLEPRGIK
jgi:hypothetical protein